MEDQDRGSGQGDAGIGPRLELILDRTVSDTTVLVD